MALVTVCRVCERMSNLHEHEDCRAAKLEDLLNRIQTYIQVSPDKPLPAELVQELVNSQFQTLKEFLTKKRADIDKERQKELWSLNLQEHLRLARAEFEKNNPDPNPIMYA